MVAKNQKALHESHCVYFVPTVDKTISLLKRSHRNKNVVLFDEKEMMETVFVM